MPTGATPEIIEQARASLSELAEAAGRDPKSINITVHSQPADKDLVKRFEEAGADRILMRLAGADQAELLVDLEETARIVLG